MSATFLRVLVALAAASAALGTGLRHEASHQQLQHDSLGATFLPPLPQDKAELANGRRLVTTDAAVGAVLATEATQCVDSPTWFAAYHPHINCAMASAIEFNCRTIGEWRGKNDHRTANQACCKCKLLASGMPWSQVVEQDRQKRRAANPVVDKDCKDSSTWQRPDWGHAMYDCAWISESESRSVMHCGASGVLGKEESGNEACCMCKWLSQGRTWEEALDLANGGDGGLPAADQPERRENAPGFFYYASQFDCEWFAGDAAARCSMFGQYEWPAGNGSANEQCCACKDLSTSSGQR